MFAELGKLLIYHHSPYVGGIAAEHSTQFGGQKSSTKCAMGVPHCHKRDDLALWNTMAQMIKAAAPADPAAEQYSTVLTTTVQVSRLLQLPWVQATGQVLLLSMCTGVGTSIMVQIHSHR
jgi:hypothetical protein